MDNVAADLTRRHLEKLLASDHLGKADASRKLLGYLAERSLRGEAPKEIEIAIDVFGKQASFNGSEDSLVRVHARALRQKLAEYYEGPGREDELRCVIPKGGYRLTVQPRPDLPSAAPPAVPAAPKHRWLVGILAVALSLLALSLMANAYLGLRLAREEPFAARIQQSAVWADLAASRRTLTIVIGDFFMYTLVDSQTGRTLTVRDPAIDSSEQLRAFLASDPQLAAHRGQRYSTMIAKSAVLGMAQILPIVDRPDRRVEIRTIEEVSDDDIRNNDIIYVGPFVRLGALGGHYLRHSRYRYDAVGLVLTDTVSQGAYAPAGELADQRLDYGLIAKFPGPTGNRIMLFTSVGRNAGLLQTVSTLTSPRSLEDFEAQLSLQSAATPASFEALLEVTGFKRTNLAATIVQVDALPAPQVQPSAVSRAEPAGL